MKMVEIKNGARTTFKYVPNNWNPEKVRDIPQGDLTTGTANHVAQSMSKEQFNKIFEKGVSS